MKQSRRDILKAGGLAGLGALTGLGFVPVHTDRLRAMARFPRTGESWNESVLYRDELTGREVRRLTTKRHNATGSARLGSAFSADGRFLFLVSFTEEGNSALLRAKLSDGELTVLDQAYASDPFMYAGHELATSRQDNLVALVRRAEPGFPPKELVLLDGEQPGSKQVLSTADNNQEVYAPSFSADGKYLYFARSLNPGRYGAGVQGQVSLRSEIVRVALSDLREEVLYVDDQAFIDQVITNPLDSNLLLVKRHLGPKFRLGGDGGKQASVYIFNLVSKKLTPVLSQNQNHYQIGMAWNFAGDRVLYQGLSGWNATYKKGPENARKVDSFWEEYRRLLGLEHYLGIADLAGHSLAEETFPHYYPGFISAHPQENGIVSGALTTPDLLQSIVWKREESKANKFEILGRHASEWKELAGFSGVVAEMSGTGQYLAYTMQAAGRTDVYVLKLF